MRQRYMGARLGWRSQQALDLFNAEQLSTCGLARRLGISYQLAQQTVMRLERLGLVEREWLVGRYRYRSPVRVVV